jgi:hypothetical protein
MRFSSVIRAIGQATCVAGLAVACIANGTDERETAVIERPEADSLMVDEDFARFMVPASVRWPTLDAQSAAEDRYTDDARKGAVIALIKVLKPGLWPFDKPADLGPGGIGEMLVENQDVQVVLRALTPAVLSDGREVVYCRWRADGMHLQVAAQRQSAWFVFRPVGRRAASNETDALADYAVGVLKQCVNGGEQAFADLFAEAKETPFGASVQFRRKGTVPKKSYAVPKDTPWVFECTAMTDGVSVLLEIRSFMDRPVIDRSERAWFIPPTRAAPVPPPPIAKQPEETPEDVQRKVEELERVRERLRERMREEQR